MRNLNEPRKDPDVAWDVSSEKRPEGEVISMESRQFSPMVDQVCGGEGGIEAYVAEREVRGW